MKTAIKIVNFIKNSVLNTRLFIQLCCDMNSEHETLLSTQKCVGFSKESYCRDYTNLEREYKHS
nr:unnamed protein product [Callosobruchus chinensis]